MENKKQYVQKFSDLRIFGSEHLSKNILEFAHDPFINDLSNTYNGTETVTAFTLSNRIVFSNDSHIIGSGGGWHRDSNNRQFKSILYLNDVTENNGVYQIIEKSHKLVSYLKDSKNGKLSPGVIRFSDGQIDRIIKNNPERLKTIVGKAGTLIVKDCSCIHRGSPLKEGKRYALTNYIFDKSLISQRLVDHFSPIVSPEYVLKLKK